MSKLKILRASAGSGKTHALTKEYLLLAFRTPQNFSTILAVTFTNKAANEMKERILSELKNIVNESSQSVYFQYIKQAYPKYDDVLIVKRSEEILSHILHNYSQFAVSTMDSFVQKIVRAFSFEMRLQSAYKIEMDYEKVKGQLAEMLYQSMDYKPEVLQWLVQFVQHRIDENKNWDFRDELIKLSSEIFKERFQQLSATPSFKEQIEKTKLNKLIQELQKIRRNFEVSTKKIAQTCVETCQKHGIVYTALGTKFKSIYTYLTVKIVEPKKTDDYYPLKTVQKAMEGREYWQNKSAKGQVIAALDSIYQPINQLLSDAIDLMDSSLGRYLGAKEVLKQIYTFGLITDIYSLLPEYREINNSLLISDINILLKKIINENETPFIYEKIGMRYNHILIDEFQDTSKFQWENFKPLITNSLSSNYNNLIVGDIKQSIYRWRGGDWNLLLSSVEKEIGTKRVLHEVLENNWRSQKNIVDFNNTLFNLAPQYLQQFYNEGLSGVNDKLKKEVEAQNYLQILTDAYADSFQKIPALDSKAGGRVKIHFFKPENPRSKKSWREKLPDVFPQTIDELLREKNYLPKDIAILVRKNAEGQEIIDLLLQYMAKNPDAAQYGIISGDSLFVSKSLIVRILVSAIKYLVNKNDEIELKSLLYNYQKIDGKKTDAHGIFSAKRNDLSVFLPAEFLKNTQKLRKLDIYNLTESLIRIFELQKHEEEHPYLRAFQDAVLDFIATQNTGTVAFLLWWENEAKKLTIQMPENQDSITVMTIHKSKGLSFKLVLVPFCDWSLDHSYTISPILWAKSSSYPFQLFDYLPVKYSQTIGKTEFAFDYLHEKLHTFVDALNMLYVAFTRPEQELIIMTAATDGKKLSSVADLLNRAVKMGTQNPDLQDFTKYFNSESNIFTIDNNYTYAASEIKKTARDGSFQMHTYPSFDWQNKVKIKYNSEEFFIENVDFITERVNYGTLMHEILASIKTQKDIKPALQLMFFAGKINMQQYKKLLVKLNEIVSFKLVSDWFSDSWKVLNEKAILDAKGNIKIPDRILIQDKKAVVIDFKFGKPFEKHKEQINTYAKLLQEMGYEKISSFLYYPDRQEVIEVN